MHHRRMSIYTTCTIRQPTPGKRGRRYRPRAAVLPECFIKGKSLSPAANVATRELIPKWKGSISKPAGGLLTRRWSKGATALVELRWDEVSTTRAARSNAAAAEEP